MSAGSPNFARSAIAKPLWLPENAVDMAALVTEGALTERALGRAMGLEIRATLDAMPAEAVLLIDLHALRRVDFFALRELIMALDMTCGKGRTNRYPIFGVDPANTELVETLEIIARDRHSVLPTVNAMGEWRAMGRLTGMERATLAVILAIEAITASELSEQCVIPISAASNRLRRLHALCLIRREERSIARGGREFLYCSLLAPPRPNRS